MSCVTMRAEARAGETTLDGALGGRLRLRQPRRGHRFGHDGVLLAAATALPDGGHAVDLGGGVGIAGLALAHRIEGARVTLVDRDPALVALAAENIATNRLADRVRSVCLDVEAGESAFAAAGLLPGTAEVVLMNPPFNEEARFASSPNPDRTQAHRARPGLLPGWVEAAERLLACRGTLTLIWRADGLHAALNALAPGFGDVVVLPVHPKPEAVAIRVVLRATRGSRGPLALRSGLCLNDAEGRPTARAEAILRGAQPLALE